MIQSITRAELLCKIAEAEASNSGGFSPRFSLLADCKLGEQGAPYPVRSGLTGTIDNSLIPPQSHRPGVTDPRTELALRRSLVWITVADARRWCDAHPELP